MFASASEADDQRSRQTDNISARTVLGTTEGCAVILAETGNGASRLKRSSQCGEIATIRSLLLQLHNRHDTFFYKVYSLMNLVSSIVILFTLLAIAVSFRSQGGEVGRDIATTGASYSTSSPLDVVSFAMAKETASWTSKNNEEYQRFTLSHPSGVEVNLISLGATVTDVKVPLPSGEKLDVTLGFDNIDQYLDRAKNPYFGASVGRVANRIKDGTFNLNGKTFNLTANNGKHHLHGGPEGFSRKNWHGEIQDKGSSVVFSYMSSDDEENYPGNVIATAKYSLGKDGELILTYQATSDRPTPINLCNHLYWNLGGHSSGNINDHIITINANNYMPVNKDVTTTGAVNQVGGTPFDFRTKTKLGDVLPNVVIDAADRFGFDHNYVINRYPGQGLSFAVRAEHPKTGVSLEVFTDQPGVQFYTGNFLPLPSDEAIKGKAGANYSRHGGFCLETQLPPNAINHVDGYASGLDVILNPGQVYVHRVVYKLSAK